MPKHARKYLPKICGSFCTTGRANRPGSGAGASPVHGFRLDGRQKISPGRQNTTAGRLSWCQSLRPTEESRNRNLPGSKEWLREGLVAQGCPAQKSWKITSWKPFWRAWIFWFGPLRKRRVCNAPKIPLTFAKRGKECYPIRRATNQGLQVGQNAFVRW